MANFLKVVIQNDNLSSFGLDAQSCEKSSPLDTVQKNLNLITGAVSGATDAAMSVSLYDDAILTHLDLFFINVQAGDTFTLAGTAYIADDAFSVGADDEETCDSFIANVVNSSPFNILFTYERINSISVRIKGKFYVDYAGVQVSGSGGLVLSGPFQGFFAPEVFTLEVGKTFNQDLNP